MYSSREDSSRPNQMLCRRNIMLGINLGKKTISNIRTIHIHQSACLSIDVCVCLMMLHINRCFYTFLKVNTFFLWPTDTCARYSQCLSKLSLPRSSWMECWQWRKSRSKLLAFSFFIFINFASSSNNDDARNVANYGCSLLVSLYSVIGVYVWMRGEAYSHIDIEVQKNSYNWGVLVVGLNPLVPRVQKIKSATYL